MFTMCWSLAHGTVSDSELTTRAAGQKIRLSKDLFILTYKDGSLVRSSAMRMKDVPQVTPWSRKRAEEGATGQQVSLEFEDTQRKLVVRWRAILPDNANYLRQEVSLQADENQPISDVALIDLHTPSARVEGNVKGSPAIIGNAFVGFEHPLSLCVKQDAGIRCSMHRELPLRSGQTLTYSSVIGIFPKGQLRRAFLNYIEAERPRPYQPFLHYNTWYDIGFGKTYDQIAALDSIHAFGEELVRKRKVKLDSFLFDDGWDDRKTMWSFGPGFPEGFTPIKKLAEEYGAEPGVWLSPWGGYDEAKQERLKYARAQGLETNAGGFELTGPKYYKRFHEVSMDFIHKYGVNQFKIDGTGNVNRVLPGSEFDSDFQAAISLISDWRRASPGIFINLTTGTYASPFWLRYADSIWRGGDDHSFAGVGPWREKWITYRDGQTYRNIVRRGPLFPLNSLMLHGILYARYAEHLDRDPTDDFSNEVHDYFGSGTQLQEMYITHSLMTDKDWDVLAQAAKWSRKNADVLVDTHWIGGDPNQLQVYGWAAWAPRKGVITLRNPSDHAQNYALDVGKAFELPPGQARRFRMQSVWSQAGGDAALVLAAGQAHAIALKPFEVLTLEAVPFPEGPTTSSTKAELPTEVNP